MVSTSIFFARRLNPNQATCLDPATWGQEEKKKEERRKKKEEARSKKYKKIHL